MDPWPFTKKDWGRINRITGRMTNATLADDDVLRESIGNEFDVLMAKLETKYGEHPVLLETLADFTEDKDERLALYRRALDLAEKHQLPTLTIRIWLANLLLKEFDDAKGAMTVLKQGKEVPMGDDAESDWIEEFSEAWQRCQARLG